MTIWFTADTHFGHDNLRRKHRPQFADVTEMDEHLIAMWNTCVAPTDTVWHLGDFSWYSRKTAAVILERLHGHIHLVKGNHDDKTPPGFVSVVDMKYLRIGEARFHLCHYPMASWRRKEHGGYHLHGHSHGKGYRYRNRMDVGVDCWEFRPIEVDEVLARLRRRALLDHAEDE